VLLAAPSSSRLGAFFFAELLFELLLIVCSCFEVRFGDCWVCVAATGGVFVSFVVNENEL
jgi:hypothetical protein